MCDAGRGADHALRVGLGIRDLSMGPRCASRVRQALARVACSEVQTLASQALACRASRDVAELIAGFLTGALAVRIPKADGSHGLTAVAHGTVPLRVGVALGAGSAAAMAQIGALEVLAEAGIPLHCVAGTSAGAIVGSAWAAGRLADFRAAMVATTLRGI